MKNSLSQSCLYNVSPNPEKERLENLQKKLKTSSHTFNSTMTERLIMPPARVWGKIEKILDEQDARKSRANDVIASSSFMHKPNSNRARIRIASSIAGLGLLAGLVWIIR
jgi:hypothetical protein